MSACALSDLLLDGHDLRGANRRVVEIGFGGQECASRSLDLFSRRLDDGFVRFGGGARLLAFARRGVALFRQRGEAFGVGSRLFVTAFGSSQRGFCRRDVRLSLADAPFGVHTGLIKRPGDPVRGALAGRRPR